MSKDKSTTKNEKPAAKEEATAKPAREPRVDTKGPHKAKALADARAAFKALGSLALATLDTVEQGTATQADYTTLKARTDAFKIAINSLGCHFQPVKAKEAKASK